MSLEGLDHQREGCKVIRGAGVVHVYLEYVDVKCHK